MKKTRNYSLSTVST